MSKKNDDLIKVRDDILADIQYKAGAMLDDVIQALTRKTTAGKGSFRLSCTVEIKNPLKREVEVTLKGGIGHNAVETRRYGSIIKDPDTGQLDLFQKPVTPPEKVDPKSQKVA